MTAVLGVNYTKSIDPISTNILDIVADNTVKCLSDEYTCATLVAGSTIKMGKILPAGAVIIEVILSHAALGSNTALAVGDSTTSDRYLVAAASTSDAVRKGPSVTAGQGYVIGTAASDGIILITTSDSGAATGKIKLDILYKCNSAA